MGKSSDSMAIFNSHVSLPEGISINILVLSHHDSMIIPSLNNIKTILKTIITRGYLTQKVFQSVSENPTHGSMAH